MTDEQSRLLAYPQQYLGLAELAEVLGLSEQACSNAVKRGKIVEPDARLALGPVWNKYTLLPWLFK